MPRFLVVLIALLGGWSTAQADPQAGRGAKGKGDVPPPCRSSRVEAPARPPATSMPELFARMGEGFARNPAGGFPAFLGELARLEGPALEGIRLSADEERQIGRRAREEYLRRAAQLGHPLANDPDRIRYLRGLVDQFAGRMRSRARYRQIEVTLIDAREADGQSFPGGFLVFTTGLLNEPDEATVAGVVAHELAHLERGHLYDYARREKLAEATYSQPNMMDFDRFFTRQAALLGLMMNPFRPEQESEADCTSVTWLYQEGYDPAALVGFFERLNRQLNDQPDPPFFAFGRSHPFSLQRRDDSRGRLAELQRWKPRADLGRYPDNLRRLVPKGKDAAKE